jgi:hypothetical protein
LIRQASLQLQAISVEKKITEQLQSPMNERLSFSLADYDLAGELAVRVVACQVEAAFSAHE